MAVQTGSASTGYWDDLCIVLPFAINPTGPDGSMTIVTDPAGYIGALASTAVGHSCVVSFQLPHTYQVGTDIHPHIHVVRNDATDNTGNVEFEAKFRVTGQEGSRTAGAL